MPTPTAAKPHSAVEPAPRVAPAGRPTAALRYFYSVAALICLAFMLWGFNAFYFRGQAYPGRPLTPPIKSLIIAHGVTMTGWILLFLAQPLLIATRRHRLHMTLGKLGAVLTAVIVYFGWRLGIEAIRLLPPEMRFFSLTPKQFLAVPNVSILVFAAFVIVGIWRRRRPEVHRPMMLMATLAALPAAINRIDFLNGLYAGTVFETLFGPFFIAFVLAAVLLAAHVILTGRVSRPFLLGFAALTAGYLLIMHGSQTAVWDGIATYLLS